MEFNELVKNLDLSLSDAMLLKYEKYYNKLVEVNKYMNLTAIVDKNEVYIKHFYDSLSLNLAINNLNGIKICDVGAGAGFPSVPLAIARDDINVTIIDSLNKRINFLNDLVKELNINNVIAVHSRAEDFAQNNRESFDVVTARAVARLNILSELCLPLVKVGGLFVAMKSDNKEEIEEGKSAINALGGQIEKIIEFDLPYDMGKRNVIIIRKVRETNKKYPRMFSKIKERPL
ncbi:MAG: 16S rRNA (guanine(527)-N(7))-methyltransferase RsmG [Acholeplasmatales bacterium]|nr:16S rRNA (guanine(527)-N(7))-methyltransferase RsmG [Acholeplasmatales bacterium]